MRGEADELCARCGEKLGDHICIDDRSAAYDHFIPILCPGWWTQYRAHVYQAPEPAHEARGVRECVTEDWKDLT